MCGRFYLAIGTGVPSSLTLPVLHPPTLSTVFTWQVPWVLAVFLRVTDSKAIDIVQGIIIEWQELLPIVVACVIRHPVFTGKRPKFRCDTLISMKDNFLVWSCRVLGLLMTMLSFSPFFQIQCFGAVTPIADQRPCIIPPSLMSF